MRRPCWIVLLAAGLTGCPCTTEEITVTYAITDAEAKEGCDDFCGQAVLCAPAPDSHM